MTRREALASYGLLFAGEPPGRITPVEELVNAFEVEAMTQRKLDKAMFAEIAGSDRQAFDRITFRPRMMVNTTGLDLTIDLFGQKLFTPILIGPTSQQKRYHPDGELAMVRGASAAKAVVVVSSRSSYPIDRIAAQANTPLWYQINPLDDPGAARKALECGCKAVCLTLGKTTDWRTIDRLRKEIEAPFLLKGITTPNEAQEAVRRGVQGIVVSSYERGTAASIEELPAIADAVSGKAPILIDGSFRRGSDVLKALALGAQAVLLGRPPLWGLAGYGAEGVKCVIELIQSELARNMAMLGKVNPKMVDRASVKIHR